MEKLKSCPFCGQEVELKHDNFFPEWNMYWIEHKEIEPYCYLTKVSAYQGKKEDLIELWNRRSYE